MWHMLAVAWLLSQSVQAAHPDVPLTLDAAVALAEAGNPSIRAARARVRVAGAGRAVAGEHPNPELRVELERETPKEAYGVAVPIELGGKRSRRLAVSEAAVRTSEAELDAALADLRADVRRAYFASAVAESRLTVLRELRDIAVRVRDAAAARFDAGSAPRLELVRAELALAQVENDVTAAMAATAATRAAFNALLGRPVDDVVSFATALDAGPLPDPAAAVAAALAGNGELAVLSRRVAAQEARLALARAARVPDVIPEAALTRNAAPEFDTGWRAALSVTLPIFATGRAGVVLEEVTLASARAELEAATARVTAEVSSAARLAIAQHEQYVRYRDAILPQAQAVEQMAEDAYTLGQSGITEFLQALQAARETRLQALQAAADFQDTLSELDRATGRAGP